MTEKDNDAPVHGAGNYSMSQAGLVAHLQRNGNEFEATPNAPAPALEDALSAIRREIMSLEPKGRGHDHPLELCADLAALARLLAEAGTEGIAERSLDALSRAALRAELALEVLRNKLERITSIARGEGHV